MGSNARLQLNAAIVIRSRETPDTMNDLVRENVQSYPRPPALEPARQRIVIRLGGQVIADTTAAFRVLETHHAPTYYLPPGDITAKLRPAAGHSLCEWKGFARYYDVESGSVTARRAAWAYDKPMGRFSPIAGYIAFYAGLMDACFVGSEQAVPQPGDFYGGWVTSNLDGIPKGARHGGLVALRWRAEVTDFRTAVPMRSMKDESIFDGLRNRASGKTCFRMRRRLPKDQSAHGGP